MATREFPFSISIRNFIFHCFETFSQINESSIDNAYIVYYSERFRENLNILISDVDNIARDFDDGLISNTSSQDINEIYDLAKGINRIWHICEIFRMNPSKFLSINFSNWIQEYIPFHDYDDVFDKYSQLLEPENELLGSISFWDNVYQLALGGRIPEALDLLGQHSEIKSALGLNDNRSTASHRTPQNRNAVLHSDCVAFFECLRSHPYAQYINEPDQLRTAAVANPQAFESLFFEWREKVRQLRESRSSVVLRVPEIDTLLRILQGDKPTMNQYCSNNWMLYCLGLFLYVYPPPLSRANIEKVVDESVQDFQSHINEKEKKLIHFLLEIIHGDVGPVLKALYELNQASLSSLVSHMSPMDNSDETNDSSNMALRRDVVSLISLSSLSHLTYLLFLEGSHNELGRPLPSSQEGISFFEHLFLQLSSVLMRLDFNPKMMLAYCSLCPINGRQYARNFLMEMKALSDSQTIRITDNLRSLGFEEDADVLLNRRAQWWLDQNQDIKDLPIWNETHDFVSNTTSTVPNAIRLFQLARNNEMVEFLLEKSLFHCMEAVVNCTTLFPGLYFPPTPPLRPISSAKVDSLDLPIPIRPVLPSQVALDPTALNTFVPLSNTKYLPVTNPSDEFLVQILDAVLLEAQQIMDVLDCGLIFPSPEEEDAEAQLSWPVPFEELDSSLSTLHPMNNLQRRLYSLSIYVEAIKPRFSNAQDYSIDVFRRQARLIGSLVIAQQPFVSIRYSLHVLELINWFFRSITQFAEHFGPDKFANDKETASMDLTEDRWGMASLHESKLEFIFSKAEAYKISCILNDVMLHPSFSLLRGDAPEAEDVLNDLRIATLRILMQSILYENAHLENSQYKMIYLTEREKLRLEALEQLEKRHLNRDGQAKNDMSSEADSLYGAGHIPRTPWTPAAYQHSLASLGSMKSPSSRSLLVSSSFQSPSTPAPFMNMSSAARTPPSQAQVQSRNFESWLRSDRSARIDATAILSGTHRRYLASENR